MSGLLRSTATVCFREVPERELDAGAKAECAEHWARAQSVNPSLFDGAVLLASDLRWSGSSCEVDFFEGSYSRYHWVRCTGRRYGPGALFASVLATTLEGALLAGCMAETTSTPGRIQLPGGNIERVRREPLDIRTAMASAARELAEEVGIQVDTGELELTHVKSGGDHGDVGLIFSVRLPRAIPHLASVFAQHLQSLARAGAAGTGGRRAARRLSRSTTWRTRSALRSG